MRPDGASWRLFEDRIQEFLSWTPAKQRGQKPVLVDGRVSKTSDFRRTPGLPWCPYSVEAHFFDYTKGTGEDAWKTTERIKVLELRANASPVGTIAPYSFPFDTIVYDSTEKTGAVVVPPVQPTQFPSLMPPDAFCSGLTPDSALSLLEETE